MKPREEHHRKPPTGKPEPKPETPKTDEQKQAEATEELWRRFCRRGVII